MLGQRRLDLTQLDAVPGDLHLKVVAPEELDVAARQVAAEVARPVQALARHRVLDKALARLLLVAPVAAREADAADVEVARHPRRAVFERRVQNVKALIQQRSPVRDALPVGVNLLDRVVDRPDGGFGRAAKADDLRARRERPRLLGQAHGNPVAAQEHDPQRIEADIVTPLRVLDQHLHQRRH